MRKIDMEIAQNGLPSPREFLGAYLRLPSEPFKHCSHNENWSCIKKIKFGNILEQGPRDFLFAFRFPMSQNMKKQVSRKKIMSFDKFIIKHVQNKYLYNKFLYENVSFNLKGIYTSKQAMK